VRVHTHTHTHTHSVEVVVSISSTLDTYCCLWIVNLEQTEITCCRLLECCTNNKLAVLIGQYADIWKLSGIDPMGRVDDGALGLLSKDLGQPLGGNQVRSNNVLQHQHVDSACEPLSVRNCNDIPIEHCRARPMEVGRRLQAAPAMHRSVPLGQLLAQDTHPSY
jgi:hypothetical protein